MCRMQCRSTAPCAPRSPAASGTWSEARMRFMRKGYYPIVLGVLLGVCGASWRVVQVTAGGGDAAAVCPHCSADLRLPAPLVALLPLVHGPKLGCGLCVKDITRSYLGCSLEYVGRRGGWCRSQQVAVTQWPSARIAYCVGRKPKRTHCLSCPVHAC